jgi:YegS/Rv2252/BmrU family lipid kinase
MVSTKRYKVILNPTAAKGKAGERAAEIEALLTKQGIEHRVFPTKAVWHAAELARDAAGEGWDVVVAAGGDGTVNEVINGLMLSADRGEKAPTLGVLSVGRGNDFSYGADVPAGLSECIEALARGQVRHMDVGRITGGSYPEGRYFGNGIGVGFDTIVGLEAAKMRHVHGFMAYVFGALRTFVMFPKAPELVVALDGDRGERYAQASHQVSIMNGSRMGGTFFMAPHALNHDGLFDLCLAEKLTRGEIIQVMGRFTKGSQASHAKIKTARAGRYTVTAPEGGLVVHADGETICTDGRSIEVECLPSRLSIIIDAATQAKRALVFGGAAS